MEEKKFSVLKPKKCGSSDDEDRPPVTMADGWQRIDQPTDQPTDIEKVFKCKFFRNS